MSKFTKTLGASLTALALGGAIAISSGAASPALAGGGHYGGYHGGWGHHGGWKHHRHGWRRHWHYGYAPAFYGGCYWKRSVDFYGDIVVRKVCY